jgi:NADPH:quinone reductase-like Zn-dependent oxidoreductase
MLLLTMSPNAVYGRPRAGLIDDKGNYTMDMTGKTVMITGASRGIGAEAARVFADAGANVVLMARSQDAIADLAGEIGKQAIAIPCKWPVSVRCPRRWKRCWGPLAASMC